LGKTEAEMDAYRARYAGHEIACHTVTHGWPARMPLQSVTNETMEDRRILEKLAGYPTLGMSYPSGSYSDEAVMAMQACGILYSRTVKSHKSFVLPEDFMRWNPTCHHNDARLMTLLETFKTVNRELRLMYVWGHSYEFDNNQNWEVIEKFCEEAGGNPEIWYATNIEIYDYVQAYQRLQFDVNMTRAYNPSVIPVWVALESWPINRTDTYCIMPGETVTFKK
jgi:peptidoglycan/xylan/chitin deacetylase (PgdA/CDA1 family)